MWTNIVVRLGVLALLVTGALVPGHPAASAGPGRVTCTDVTLPVSVAAGGPKRYSMYGRLCQPVGGPSRIIQVLVHGFTYDHDYWALPGFGGRYDYTAVANAAGHTTFAIDRLGSAGRSSRPPGALVTLPANAASLHDVVTAARSGALPGGPYATVLTVGHSLGAAAVYQEAAQFDDVDGVIASDLGHPLGNLQGLGTSLVPALLDPRLRPLVGLDAGYLTTTPGSRGPLFYRDEDTDPAVVVHDEQTKGIGTVGELATAALYETATLGIRVPVLFVMGQYDGLFCRQAGKGGLDDCSTAATLSTAEKPFFPLVPDFETFVLAGAGHNINYELNAGEWFAEAADWATTRFPPQG